MSPPIPCPESLMPLLSRWSWITVGLEGEQVESLPDLGIDLLSAGYNTQEIMTLAVCAQSDHPADLRRAAQRAFASIGVPAEDRMLHLRVVGRSVTNRIVGESLPAEEGLTLMLHLDSLSPATEWLSDWVLLEEAIFLFRDGCGGLGPYTNLTEAKITEIIRTLARQFLAENPVLLHPPSS